MNMLSTCIVAMLLFAPLVLSQQCRQVTVCNGDTLNLLKGDKGDVGSRGPKGEVGGVGEKGMQGESCDLSSLKSTLMSKLAELEDRLIPESCHLSLIHGRQTLRGGEEAFCENGWTVFQRRLRGDVNFTQNWKEYKQGFGYLDGDFWLGLDKIHNLTESRGCKLQVDIWTEGDIYSYAIYSDFYINDESDNYRLQVSGYSGTAGRNMNFHSGMQFSTVDRDNDEWRGHCAALYGGGWWYNRCFLYADLNQSPPMFWRPSHKVVKSIMKVRCD